MATAGSPGTNGTLVTRVDTRITDREDEAASGSSLVRSGVNEVPVCAVVVAFFPDDGFEDRLLQIEPQVEALLIVDNTPNGCGLPRLTRLLGLGGHVWTVENGSNAGVGRALNQGLEHALRLGCKWLLTLDQDTQCFGDLVRVLLRLSAACDPRPAVIGANYFDARNRRYEVLPGTDHEFYQRTTVITSGSLVDVEVARSIGGFRSDYFVDQLDHEFCLRARRHGNRVIISRKPLIVHSVGTAGGVRLPLLGTLANHPPLRKYYITRNTIATVSEYWWREPAWCIRRVGRLLLGMVLMATMEDGRIAKVRAAAAGFLDGLRERWVSATEAGFSATADAPSKACSRAGMTPGTATDPEGSDPDFGKGRGL